MASAEESIIQRMTRWSRNLNPPMVIYLSIVHFCSILGLWRVTECRWQTLLLAAVLGPLGGLGVTAGSHRLWAHRSYHAHWLVRLLLMLCNSVANQGSIYHWSRDHRVHHKYSETSADPHNAQRGFFFAHIGWLLLKKDPKVIAAGKKLTFDDLLADPFVAFQKACDPFFAFFMCFAFPTLLATYGWDEQPGNALLVAGFLRYLFLLHFTWLVNSAAHFYGDKPYDATINPTENLLVAVCAMGEGWHNWHHKYPYDYAASEFGITTQFNPTKLFIDAMATLGLVTKRKRALGAWGILKASRAAEMSKKSS